MAFLAYFSRRGPHLEIAKLIMEDAIQARIDTIGVTEIPAEFKWLQPETINNGFVPLKPILNGFFGLLFEFAS